jgi:hypothetical protein
MNERTVTFLKAVQRSFFLVLFLILVFSSISLAGTFMFEPATGQTTCYDGSGNVITCDPTAQAGLYSGDPLLSTDDGNGAVTGNNTELMFKFEPATHQTTYYDGSGNVITCPPGCDSYSGDPLPYTDDGNGTVTDNNTGLMWQKDENPSYYNWYQASGKYHATYNPSSQNVCGSLIIGSYSGWRLPTKKELMNIMDSAIPLSGRTIYWSSTTTASYQDKAWAVDFPAGAAVSNGKGGYNVYDGLHVRCVRGEQTHLRANSSATLKTK